MLNNDLFKDLNKLRPLLTKRDKWKFMILFGMMSLASLLEVIGIGAIPLFISLVMKPSSLSGVRWVGDWFATLPDKPTVYIVFLASCILFSVIVIKNVFLFFVFYVQARTVASLRINLSNRMFLAYQEAPYEWHLQRSSSELLNNITNDTDQVIRNVLMPSLELAMSLIIAVVIITFLMLEVSGPSLMSLPIIGVGLYIVINIFQKRLLSVGEVIRCEAKGIIKAIQQGFGALIDARIIGCEAYLNKVYKDGLVRQASVLKSQFVIQRSTSYVIETFTIFGLLIILLILIKTEDSLEAVLPAFTLLVVAMMRLKQLASKIAGSVNTINAARAFIPGIVNDLNNLTQKSHMKISVSQSINNFKVLKLESVTYSYPNTEVPSIHNISLEVKNGESVALVGSTGCGKSTLVNLILGLLEPQSGRITVNNTDIFQDIQGWRTHIGYIPQTIFLVDDTIRANVAFGVPQNDVNEEQLWSALNSARLDEFIMTLPKGLDTVVGERGVRLSGGQRQRLGIARALYFNPQVLVMDEATSALDNKVEAEVMQAIEIMKKNRTLIMIAHRLSTVEGCDQLYFLENGRLISAGTYDELKQVSATFRDMTMINTIQ